MANKLISDKACVEAIDNFTTNYNPEYEVDICFEFQEYWDDVYEREQFNEKNLPARVKLIKLVLQNESFKQDVQSLAELIADEMINAFDLTADEYTVQEEARKQEEEDEKEAEREEQEREKEMAKRKVAKAKLLETLSPEQREALAEVFEIAI